jgi:hypothetical protein
MFTYLNLPDYINRKIKTNIISYSKFNKTLFLDADSLVRKPGLDNIFDDYEFVNLRPELEWSQEDKIYSIYSNSMNRYKLKLPITIWHSSIILFDGYSWDFFDLWYKYWKELGYNRDMPALNCMIKKENIPVNKIKDKYHSNKIDNDSIILHGNDIFNKKFNIPECKKDKSFDKKDDWKLVTHD